MTKTLDIDPALPLVVDLDGTLTVSDTLWESFARLLFQSPLAAFGAALRLAQGRAALKRAIAAHAVLDPAAMPWRTDLLAVLRSEQARGRALHLVSAADQELVDSVAGELGLFASAIGSNGVDNLKGANKLTYLHARFTDGFLYAGDSRADLPVFRAARGVILCDVSRTTAAAVVDSGVPVLAELRQPGSALNAWRRAFRVHQWAKNLILFVPLFVGHAFGDLHILAATTLGFALLCLLSSATYLVNDIADLDADRRHETKRRRPFASGTLKIAHGLMLAPVMILTALIGGYLLAPSFAIALAAYLVLTTVYSFGLKRVPLADVFTIGVLFTLRIVMGVEIAGLTHSPWLLSFALSFFISLALSKRHGEVMRAARVDADEIVGRGYRGSDWPITLTFGIGVGLVSIVIMLLYMTNEAAPSGFYRQPAWLYLIPAVVTLWMMRVWLLSNRMELHDDPVVFALRDRLSLALGLAAAIAFYLAL
jgi:4-hydroxybenzoate polyprenyltransferase